MTNQPLPEEIREQIIKEASLALALKDALERISSLSDEYPIQVAIDIADAALKLFPEQGKEGNDNG